MKLGTIFVRSTIALALFFTITSAGSGIHAETLTLDQCLARALEQGHDLQAAKEAVRRSEAAARKVQASLWPKLSVEAAYLELEEPVQFTDFTMTVQGQPFVVDQFVFSDDSMVKATASLDIPLLTWGYLRNGSRVAKNRVRQAEVAVEGAADSLRYQVETSYNQVLIAREASRYLEDTISEMELFADTAQRHFEEGQHNAPEKDIVQVQYDLNEMRLWRSELAKWEVLGILALKTAMGMGETDQLDISGRELRVHKVDFVSTEIVEGALSHNPGLRQLDLEIENAGMMRKQARAGNLPMIGAFAKMDWLEDDLDYNQSRNSAVGVGIKWRIFDGLEAVSAAKEAKFLAVELEHRKGDGRSKMRLGVAQAVLNAQQYYEQVGILAGSRHLAIEQVRVVREGYQFGLASVKDVNEAQVQKRWADANWLFKKLEYANALSTLRQLVGADIAP